MDGTDEFALPERILRHFDLSSTPYTPSSSSSVDTRRRTFPDGKLFFDQLLFLGSIDNSLYPPTNPASFRRLLHAISSLDFDRSRRDCYFYYLLRDYDASQPVRPLTNGGMEVEQEEEEVPMPKPHIRATEFALSRCLPSAWVEFMDAYWCLDNEQWDAAVEHLTNPVILELNFFPQILQVISTHVSPPSHSLYLINQLLLQTQHLPESPREEDLKLVALASTASLAEAFDLIRQLPPLRRIEMREELWCWMLGAPRIACGAGGHTPQGSAIKQLAHLPLEQEELDHLLAFLARPPRNIPLHTLSLLHDLVTMRLVHQGQYAEAIQLDRDSAGSSGKDADRQRRREMVREFISILPDIQKRALAIEGDERADQKALERDRIGHVNGGVEQVNGYSQEEKMEEPYNSSQSIASSAYLPPARQESANGSSRPASPAPPSRPHSPFTGPPRFASTHASNPALLQRVLSGPFALPRSTSMTGSPVPRPTRRIIDDEAPSEASVDTLTDRQQRRPSPPPKAPSPQPSEPVPEPEAPEASKQAAQPVRRSQRVVSGSKPPQTEDKPTTPEPSPPARRTRSRQASQEPSTRAMPGAFDKQPVESVPEDEVLDMAGDVPPTPARSTVGNGQPPTAGRSRMTRSVSRALLDEDEENAEGLTRKKKRARKAADEETTPGPRRSTRASTRASSVLPSEPGSPTPSMASVARSETTGRRNAPRGGSAQPTPRATRSRKN